MAVPPTHDGSVGPRSTPGSTTLTAVAAALTVVIVVCLVVLGQRYADASGSVGDRLGQVLRGDDEQAAASVDDTRTRELVLSQANQFVTRINTYGPADLDKQNAMPGYVSRVKEVITPKLDVEFEKSVTFAEQSVAQAGLARTVQLYAAGADTIDTDLATVLVTGAISQSYPDPTKDGRIEYEPQLFRYEVRLVRTDGTWLVDDFTPVRGEVEGEPTAGATPGTAPSAPPTDAPSASGAGSSLVDRYAEIVGNRTVAIGEAVNQLSSCGFPAAVTDRAECPSAPRELGTAATTLANSLKGAANPDSRVFVGVPPAAVADQVTTTQDAAAAVARAVARLGDDCAAASTPECAGRRNAVTAAANELTSALTSWDDIG